jgi:hypothetical protein
MFTAFYARSIARVSHTAPDTRSHPKPVTSTALRQGGGCSGLTAPAEPLRGRDSPRSSPGARIGDGEGGTGRRSHQSPRPSACHPAPAPRGTATGTSPPLTPCRLSCLPVAVPARSLRLNPPDPFSQRAKSAKPTNHPELAAACRRPGCTAGMCGSAVVLAAGIREAAGAGWRSTASERCRSCRTRWPCTHQGAYSPLPSVKFGRCERVRRNRSPSATPFRDTVALPTPP